MKKVALIDIGSNTIRLNAYKVEGDSFSLIFSEKETFGMINFIENGRLTPHGIEKFAALMKNYRECLDNTVFSAENTPRLLYCFATAGLRRVENKDEVLAAARREAGIEIEIISGKDEAMYNFYSIRRFFNPTGGIVIDMGGGSTEFLRFGENGAEESVSVDVASLALARRFVSKIIPSKKETLRIEKYCDKTVDKIEFIDRFYEHVFITGGTARALAKIDKEIKNSDAPVNGYSLKTQDIELLLRSYIKDKKSLVPLIIKEIPERANSFVPGLIMYCRIFRKLKCQTVTVSSFGVREGYLLKIINDGLDG